MPATPTLRKSSRQARVQPASPAVRRSLRLACARVAAALPVPADGVACNTLTPPLPTVKAARARGRPRTSTKQMKEVILRSDDEADPPTVQEMVTGVFANQATKELKVVKKDLDGLKREVALLRQERDFLFPIVNAVKEFSLCAICYDCFRRPVVLRCGHAFCEKCFHMECIAQTTRISPDASRTAITKALDFYYCPTCRTFTGRDLPPNIICGLTDTLKLIPRE